MLAPNTAATGDKPVEKFRTITLTNRAPVQISEQEWPVIAHGACGGEEPQREDWVIEIRVRKDKFGRIIVHGKYALEVPGCEEFDQLVRVGRYLHACHINVSDIWAAISAIGDELRERIACDKFKKHVIYAVDSCFAALPPQKI